MIKMGYDERQIIKKVVEENLQRPPGIEIASMAAQGRYRKQVQSAMELFRVVVDPKQPILVMAKTFAVAKALESALGKGYKVKYVHDRHSLQGMSNCVVINVRPPSHCERFDHERHEMLEVVRTLRDIDFWNFGDF